MARKHRKKKSAPTPASNTEPDRAPPQPPINNNFEGLRIEIDSVLRAESITESVRILLHLQHQKIESLLEVHNTNKSLRRELLELLGEKLRLLERIQDQKKQLVAWKEETVMFRAAMIWAEAFGCTHFDKRILAEINDTRCQILDEESSAIRKNRKDIERVKDPEKRQLMKEQVQKNMGLKGKALTRMYDIALEAESKKKNETELKRTGGRSVQSSPSAQDSGVEDKPGEDPVAVKHGTGSN